MRQSPPRLSDLSEMLRREIAGQGVISFARFMELALYSPGLGYYERPSKQIGCHGDFYTSASVGSVFGELLAFQFAAWLDDLDRLNPAVEPFARFQLVEAGAHDGRLAVDILNWFRQYRPELEPKLEYWLIEPSPERAAWQSKTLTEFGAVTRWFQSWAEIPSPVRGVIFSNELLDAFPVHRIVWDAPDQRWREWGVAWNGDQFVWSKLPAFTSSIPDSRNGDDLLSQVRQKVAHATTAKSLIWPELPGELQAALPHGFATELSPAATTWWREAARSLKQGKLMTLDYGLAAEEFFLPERASGTLRAYHRQHHASDLLAHPGEQDLTAHVNFTALTEGGAAEGLTTDRLASQSQFLTRVVGTITQTSARFAAWTPKRLRQFRTLAHPEHLGRSFKVLVQSRSSSKPDMPCAM